MDFSVVVPVSENDASLVPRTLPRWLALPADEVILCVDKPASQHLIEVIRENSRGDDRLRVVEVPRESGWMFHQAFVRRTGFKSARFDKIGFFDVVQNSTRRVIRALKKEAYFTGLYALYRPFWLETEDEESAKKIPHPLSHGALEREDDFFVGLASGREATPPPYLGDDTMLKRAMLKKYRVVSLPHIGGVEVRTETDNRPAFQARQAVRLFYSQVLITKFGTWFFLRELLMLPLSIILFSETLALRALGVPAKRRRL